MIRYFGDYITDSLSKNRLKVALPSKLNDPFDFSLTSHGELTSDEALRSLYERINEPGFYSTFRERPEFQHLTNDKIYASVIQNLPKFVQAHLDSAPSIKDKFKTISYELGDEHYRILCFSDSSIDVSSDILMWSYYGDSHQGYRLHFDTSFLHKSGIQEKKVEYAKERVSISISATGSDPEFHDGIKKSMYVKGEHWIHENETRYLITPALCKPDPETNFEYVDFPEEALRRVDIGIRANSRANSKVVKEVEEILRTKRFKHVEIYQASIHDSLFSIKYIKKK